MTESSTIQLMRALTAIWDRIRGLHPDVPDVVLLPAPSPSGRMNILGYFAALRWRTRSADGELVHEVAVVAEHLDRSATDVLETLLHEAAHAANFARGIRDCSRSQYHNGRFKAAAEELGLVVTQVQHYGFAKTELRSGTVDRYTDLVQRLDSVLIHRRKPPKIRTGSSGSDGARPRSASRSLKATCSCDPPFIIRVSRSTLTSTEIRCERCGSTFAERSR